MSQPIHFEDLIADCPRERVVSYGFRVLLKPAANEARFANAIRLVCCAWCRACQDRIANQPASLQALLLIEEFNRGNAPGDSLSLARKLAKKSSRRVARLLGKSTQYWACHAGCEAARNNAYEAVLWTSDALKEAGLYIDHKLAVFKQVARGTASNYTSEN